MRPFFGILIGLAIGIAGTSLFIQSLPPEEGSAVERAEIAESALKKARVRIAEFQDGTGTQRAPPGRIFPTRPAPSAKISSMAIRSTSTAFSKRPNHG